MIFHKYRLICVGIPKNASSSMFDLLKNHTDKDHNHNTILIDFQYNDPDLMESYLSFCVVRNPYDRFFSACEQIKRDNADNFNLNTSQIIEQELTGVEYYNEVFIPQYKFVSFGNQILVNKVLSYENLAEDWYNFAEEYNKTALFKIKKALPQSNKTEERIPWEEELKIVGQEKLDLINQMYERDFKLFGYKMIDKV